MVKWSAGHLRVTFGYRLVIVPVIVLTSRFFWKFGASTAQRLRSVIKPFRLLWLSRLIPERCVHQFVPPCGLAVQIADLFAWPLQSMAVAFAMCSEASQPSLSKHAQLLGRTTNGKGGCCRATAGLAGQPPITAS